MVLEHMFPLREERENKPIFLVHPKSLKPLNVYGRCSKLLSYKELVVQQVKQ